ncbi:hypothetical protein GGTG_11685 [Gaeumannomyces tritici R3-111a-1]|uniref:Uncharacterized protein n=1 Tax=Gaeumannomyces tritici (strain R3-111a-1) TaxID=644352 RepID=J3PDW2_GAET3|nr:hypothetical protein GGTG_11685 [Gaeumannomyces tritici R3-111a-1]EJT70662.1 hypothetical protein GGTG_11685 [Gaeumannomyces tritici R3-111a-1]
MLWAYRVGDHGGWADMGCTDLTPAEGGIEGTNGCEPGTGWYAPDPKTNGPAMAVWYKDYRDTEAIRGGGGLIGPCQDKTNTIGKNPREQKDPKMRILVPPNISAALESAALEASRLPQGEGSGQAATANPPPPGVVVEPTTPPQQKTAADPLSEGMSKMSVEDKNKEEERGRARLKPLRSPPSPLAGQPPPKRLSPSPGGGGSRNRDGGTESSAGGRGGGSTGGASGGGASGGNGGGGK